MSLPLRILSTDFDGTLHAEFEDPPVPARLEEMIARLQSLGMAWVINTGRDMSSLMETLGRARLSIWPDYVVTVEREIHVRKETRYVEIEEWNSACEQAHAELFQRVRRDLRDLVAWVQGRFDATIYEDPFSPFCLIARSSGDAERIHEHLEQYSQGIPSLAVVRNDVYARFSHADYNKGTALSEVARRLGAGPESTVAAGDHLNDLPMLKTEHARWLISPSNAVAVVKEAVRTQGGHVSEKPHGYGVADGLERLMKEIHLD